MTKSILLSLLLAALTACNSAPVTPPGPDMTPICKDNAVPGQVGCYGKGGPA